MSTAQLDLVLRPHGAPSTSIKDSLSESDSLSCLWFGELVPLGLAATETIQKRLMPSATRPWSTMWVAANGCSRTTTELTLSPKPKPGSLPNTPELARPSPPGSSSPPACGLRLGSFRSSSRMNASSCNSDGHFFIFSGRVLLDW
ncbi:hypothetical protein EJB05_41843, partial [Eragrostis curvula]